MLPAPAALLVIVLASGSVGLLAAGLAGKRLCDDPVESIAASLAAGVLCVGWIATVLAESGCFSIGLLGGVWLALLAGLGLCWWRARRRRTALPANASASSSGTVAQGHLLTETACRPEAPRASIITYWEGAALLLWLIAAAWLYFRPHEYLFGGADAGVYVSVGASIARSGGFLIRDPVLASLPPELYPAFLRALPPSEAAPYYVAPGFYVTGELPGLITPQFYPLHSVWMAIAHALGGVRAELLLVPLWGVLGGLAVYLTARRLWGWKPALLALGALSITALQAWFARYPTSEMLTQYLLWTGIWASIAWLDGRGSRAFWAALAGSALGQVMLVRIDMYPLLVYPLLAGFWLWRRRAWRRQDLWFFAAFFLPALQSLLHGALLSSPYFFGLFGYGRALVSRYAMVLLLALLAAITSFIVVLRRPEARRFLGMRAWSRWRWSAAGLILVLAAYAYFLRPTLADPPASDYWYGGGQLTNLGHLTFHRLGWYLGPFGMAISVAGASCLLITGAYRRTALMLGMGLLFSVFYFWQIQANPHQIYAMRRLVPIVLPFFVLAATYLLHWIFASRRGRWRWLSIGLTLVWLSGIVTGARGFISQVDYRGLLAQLDRLSNTLEPKSVLIFSDPAPVGVGDFVGTPLQFLYGQTAFTLRDPTALDSRLFAQVFAEWRAGGYRVYWVQSGSGPAWPIRDTTFGVPIEHHLRFSFLENAYDHKPTRVESVDWQLTLAEIVSISSRP